MRKAAGIILIIFGLVLFGIAFLLAPFLLAPFLIPSIYGLFAAVGLLSLIVPAAFSITGGIFCLRRKYWRVCLASASFAVLASVVNRGDVLLSSNILTGFISWVVVVAPVIGVIFILRTKKEWQDISDSVDGKVSYGG